MTKVAVVTSSDSVASKEQIDLLTYLLTNPSEDSGSIPIGDAAAALSMDADQIVALAEELNRMSYQSIIKLNTRPSGAVQLQVFSGYGFDMARIYARYHAANKSA